MQRRASRLLGLLAGAGLVLPAVPALADPPAHAPAWGYRAHQDVAYHDRDDDRYEDRDDDRYGGDRDRDDDRYGRYGDYRHDRDWDHDHRYYGRRVYIVERLPRGYRAINYRGDRYFYHGNLWYRPYGPRFVIVPRPTGLAIDPRGVIVVLPLPIVH